MDSIYAEWKEKIAHGEEPPAFADIPPDPCETNLAQVIGQLRRSGVAHLVYNTAPIEPNDLLRATVIELARLGVAYDKACSTDRKFQADYMVPYYLALIALYKRMALYLIHIVCTTDEEPHEEPLEACVPE